MTMRIISFLGAALAGALCGAAVDAMLAYAPPWQMMRVAAQPLLFGLTTAAAVSVTHRGPRVWTPLMAGALSGGVYALLSPALPLAAAVLSGACIGGGAAAIDRRGLVRRVLYALRGSIVLPVFIFAGSALAQHAGMPVTMAYWGFVLGAAVAVLSPAPSPGAGAPVPRHDSSVREFCGEAAALNEELDALEREIVST